MKYAYLRNDMVEFIEERERIEELYPKAILHSFVPLDEEQEAIACKGCNFDGSKFTEPDMLSPIPTIGGYYKPNDETKFLSFVKKIEADQETYSDLVEPAAVTLTDKQALDHMGLYQWWATDTFYMADDRKRYGDKLYKCIQPHVSQVDWTPNATPSLWVVIEVVHLGTLDDPIPAVVGMEYTKGKYYIENDVIYLMNREGMVDGESIVLHFTPSQLVGQYFEVVE